MTSTTTGGITASGPGRRRLMAVLLILSLVLNLCFIAGAAWMRLHAPRPEERIQAIAGELGLNEQQRAGFDNYFHTMRARFQLMRGELNPLVGNAWTEFAKPQPDQGKIEQDFEAASAKRRTFGREATANTLSFLSTLSPEQRAKFVALMREHRAFWLTR